MNIIHNGQKNKVEEYNKGRIERKEKRDAERAARIAEDPEASAYYMTRMQRWRYNIRRFPDNFKSSSRRCCKCACGWKTQVVCCLLFVMIMIILIIALIVVWKNKGAFAALTILSLVLLLV